MTVPLSQDWKKEQMFDWIDNASYYDLKRKWKFDSVGSPWFAHGEMGNYFEQVMKNKRKALSDEELYEVNQRLKHDELYEKAIG